MNPSKKLEQENNRPAPSIIGSYETLMDRGMNFDDAMEVVNRNIIEDHQKKNPSSRENVRHAK